MDKSSRLKVALQKSGRLTENSLDLLVRCGLKYSRGKDQLMCYGENMPLDVLFVRDDDIPDLVQEDVCDLGLVGRNVIEEKRLELTARSQLAAMATGARLVEVPKRVLEETYLNYQPQTRRPYGVMEWPALLRMLDRMDPSYGE